MELRGFDAGPMDAEEAGDLHDRAPALGAPTAKTRAKVEILIGARCFKIQPVVVFESVFPRAMTRDSFSRRVESGWDGLA